MIDGIGNYNYSSTCVRFTSVVVAVAIVAVFVEILEAATANNTSFGEEGVVAQETRILNNGVVVVVVVIVVVV